MTENKRFWSDDYSVGYYTEIVDNNKELADVPNPKKNLTIEEVVDLLNEQNETIIKNEEVFKKIEDRIIQLEKELNKSKDYFRPKDSVFNNPMSDVYDKERREELSALRWVLRLRS